MVFGVLLDDADAPHREHRPGPQAQLFLALPGGGAHIHFAVLQADQRLIPVDDDGAVAKVLFPEHGVGGFAGAAGGGEDVGDAVHRHHRRVHQEHIVKGHPVADAGDEAVAFTAALPPVKIQCTMKNLFPGLKLVSDPFIRCTDCEIRFFAQRDLKRTACLVNIWITMVNVDGHIGQLDGELQSFAHSIHRNTNPKENGRNYHG